MRINKKTAFLFLATALLTSVVGGSQLLAYDGDFGSHTYFTGKENSTLQFIGKNGNYSESGVSPSTGFVMPNRQYTYAGYGGDTGQGGAVGYNALKYSGTDNLKRKTALLDLLKTANKSSSEWDKMGSALVVHQMIGRSTPESPVQAWGDSSRTITPTQWNELENRLVRNSNVTMTLVPKYNVVGVKNTSGVVYYENGNRVMDVVDFNITAKAQGDPGYEYAWVFEENGETRYVLEVNCANPIGAFGGLREYNPEEHSLAPSISAPADGSPITSGGSVEAKGSVKNTGPNNAGTKTWYITRLLYDPGFSPANKSARDSNANSGNLCAEFVNNNGCSPAQRDETFNTNQERTGNLSYAVPSGMTPGTKICFVVSVSQPTQNANPVWRHSEMRCAAVPSPSFTLVPTVLLDRDNGSVVEPGDSTNVTNTVKNEGSDLSDKTIWYLTKFVYGPTKSLSDDDKSASGKKDDVPCAAFTSDGRLPAKSGCDIVQERKDQKFDPGQSISQEYPFTVPDDTAIGTKICFVVSVSKPTYESSPLWRHTNMWCITVGKKPKMQVWGGDVRSGGSIHTSISSIAGGTYGSWAEYAALSMESNNGFASGAGLSKGNASSGQSSWSKLTFANTGGPATCTFGCFDFSLSSPVLMSQFAADKKAPNLTGTRNLNDLASGVYQAGDINLSGTTISHGKTIIIVSTGTVTIEGNITYEDMKYTSIRDIPQLIIRAPTINIRNSSGQVDAWLLAEGVLNTCSDSYGAGYDVKNGSLTADRCNNKLTVNGPVVADVIYLRRTGGSGTQTERGDPAEVFNLRADAYMWGSVYGSKTNQVQTVYSKELSPRF